MGQIHFELSRKTFCAGSRAEEVLEKSLDLMLGKEWEESIHGSSDQR